jgi:3-deoxy-manno-octulosonate cytidylyltransferase (CMP-KDO synthetase)
MAANDHPRVAAIIPARYASTRFPGKVIATLGDRPVVAHTYARACQARLVDEVVVATDDGRVADALAPFEIPIVMTRADHPSGTDRIAEAAAAIDAEIIVNVQGDEPVVDPHTIDAAVQALLDDPAIPMGTARRRITDPALIANPNVVKVITDLRGRAIYFSRHAIPFIREECDRGEAAHCYYQHIGLYVVRRAFLFEYAQMAPTPLEKLERLEQLRVLENGHPIAVVDTDYVSLGIDTPEDLAHVNALMQAGKVL